MASWRSMRLLMAALLIGTTVMPHTWMALASGGAGFPILFQRELVDSDKTTSEPLVSLATDDVAWISGHAEADVHSHVWTQVGPGQFDDVEPPAVNLPPGTEPNRDGAVFASGDGRIYWAAIRPLGNLQSELWTSSRAPAGPWTSPVKIGDNHDRPWFFSIGAQTYLVTTVTPGQPVVVRVFKAVNDGAGWELHSTIDDPAGVQDYHGGFPTALSTGRVVVPLRINGADVGAAVSDDGAQTWAITTFIRDNVAGVWHWSAGDAGGTAYVVWREALQQVPGVDDHVRFARLPAGEMLWEGAFAVTDALGEKWGASVVAGAAGNLGVAWYERDDALHPWTVRFRQITTAHADTPVLGPEVTVDGHAADEEFSGVTAFSDFLSIARQDDGQVVIAYNCYTDEPAPHAALCDQNERNPVLARQFQGPGT